MLCFVDVASPDTLACFSSTQGDSFRYRPGNVVQHLQTEDEVRAIVAEARFAPEKHV